MTAGRGVNRMVLACDQRDWQRLSRQRAIGGATGWSAGISVVASWKQRAKTGRLLVPATAASTFEEEESPHLSLRT